MRLLFTVVNILLFCYIQNAKAELYLIGYPTSQDNNSTVIIFNKWGENICSGALIHSEWVLTSATCAIKSFDEERRIKIGGKVTSDFNTAAHIKKIYIHPRFAARSLDNDIALIQLVSPTSSFVRTLKISEDCGDQIGRKVYALGYGLDRNNLPATRSSGSPYWGDLPYWAGTLREQKLTILNNILCSPYPVFINELKFCTYESLACEGDQGGPLVSEDRKTLLGLITITDDQAAICGNTMIPVTAYTRVSPYKLWIRNTTQITYL